MSLETRLIALSQAIGADIKDLVSTRGTLSSLTTTNKVSLVGAINELVTAIGGAGAAINDTAGDGNTTATWSANKIFDSIEAAKTAVTASLTNGAGAALDTLNELAAALGNDPSFAATIATQIAARVRFDAAQTLTAPQQAQALTNIGGASAANLTTLTTGLGDYTLDLTTVYVAAKA